ncbi:TetR/AcrR family transcriptional regulator [Actinokineospora bangkokensis]|uniref:TetR family transcriptional regulator n=1 Tax=Actinokineospora bangkokensis TaxID=1193682 RepID=A0A1Q9LF65_9PSEU|nr:TetR family transcriptional regulator [Actinokineospora bangkokensis]OLR90682.1 TetR family transcriptional regulator [Actinokineospora bangkokensis]
MRERILRAVLRVLGAVGVAGLTNRRIAAEAGVSLGSITYHFATQTEMLRAALLLFVREETARLAEFARERPGPVGVAEAAALVAEVVESTTFGREEIAPLELYVHAGRDPQLRPAAEECFAAYDAFAVTVLRALGVPSPERVAGAVVALVAGTQLRRLATGGGGATGLAEAVQLLVRPGGW